MNTTNLRAILAANLRAFREAKGISQDEFAGRCGLHRTYVGSVERQERNVTLATLEQLAGAMEISAAALLMPPSKKGGCQ